MNAKAKPIAVVLTTSLVDRTNSAAREFLNRANREYAALVLESEWIAARKIALKRSIFELERLLELSESSESST